MLLVSCLFQTGGGRKSADRNHSRRPGLGKVRVIDVNLTTGAANEQDDVVPLSAAETTELRVLDPKKSPSFSWELEGPSLLTRRIHVDITTENGATGQCSSLSRPQP